MEFTEVSAREPFPGDQAGPTGRIAVVGVERLPTEGRVAEGNHVKPNYSLESVIMKSPDMTQRSSITTKTMFKNLKLKKKQQGLTMVEYAVAGFLITVAAVTAFTTLGENVATVIEGIATTLG